MDNLNPIKRAHLSDQSWPGIMDYKGAMAYNLSRSLADLLKLLVREPEYFIKNTASFSKDMRGNKDGTG